MPYEYLVLVTFTPVTSVLVFHLLHYLADSLIS